MDKFLIVGNPNSGKTTLFNTLTKSREKTANYNGVTVDAKCKKINHKGKDIELVDLPGAYSITATTSKDEEVTKNYLKQNPDSNIIFLCSSTNIKKNITLLAELVQEGYKNIKVVINKNGKGLSSDIINNLQEKLGVELLQVDARKNKNQILEFLTNRASSFINKTLRLEELLKFFPADEITIKKIDKLLFSPFWGKFIFFVVLTLIILIAYGPIGNGITLNLETMVVPKLKFVTDYLSSCGFKIVADFFDKVVVGGIISVLIYLPQLSLMLTLLYMLEDSGYLPRVAISFNEILNRFGMEGQSVFSLMMGVGCTTSAVLCTRNISSSGDKKLNTMRFLPFIGCGAKFPILIMMTSMLLGSRGTFVVALLYIVSVLIGLLYLTITKKQESVDGEFILEIPPLKAPNIVKSTKQAIIITLELCKRIIVSVLIVASVVWLLGAVSVDFKFLTGAKSILDLIAEKLGFIFYPLGIKSPKLIVALISGIIAKENILSVLGVLGGLKLSLVQGLTFLIFIMLYSPCVAALKCVSCEAGKKEAVKMFFRTVLIAYIASLVFYTFSLIHIALGVCMLLGVCFLIAIFAKLYQKTLKKYRICKEFT